MSATWQKAQIRKQISEALGLKPYQTSASNDCGMVFGPIHTSRPHLCVIEKALLV